MPAPFDAKTAKLVASVEHPGTLYAVCRDPQSDRLHVAGTDGILYAVDPQAEKPALEKVAAVHENYVSCLVRHEGVAITGGYDRQLVWTDLANGARIRSLTGHDGWVRDLVLFPDGSRIASVGDDLRVRIRETATGKLIRDLDEHPHETPEGFATAVYAVDVDPAGKYVASADRIGEVRICETESGRCVQRFRAPTFYTYDPAKRSRSIGGIRAVRFSPDGKRLALAGIGVVTNVDGFVGPCRVEVWDWEAGKSVFAGQDDHKAVLNAVAWHPRDGWLLAAGGGDSGGLFAVWTPPEPKGAKVPIKGHVQRFVPDANWDLLFAVGAGGVQIWRLMPPA